MTTISRPCHCIGVLCGGHLVQIFLVRSHGLCPGRSSRSLSGLYSADGLWVVWTSYRPCVETCVWVPGHQGPPRKINNKQNGTDQGNNKASAGKGEEVEPWHWHIGVYICIKTARTVVFSVNTCDWGQAAVTTSCVSLQQQHLSGSDKQNSQVSIQCGPVDIFSVVALVNKY